MWNGQRTPSRMASPLRGNGRASTLTRDADYGRRSRVQDGSFTRKHRQWDTRGGTPWSGYKAPTRPYGRWTDLTELANTGSSGAMAYRYRPVETWPDLPRPMSQEETDRYAATLRQKRPGRSGWKIRFLHACPEWARKAWTTLATTARRMAMVPGALKLVVLAIGNARGNS